MLGLWGLSDPIVEAVAFHHEPARAPNPGFCALTAVYIANAMDGEQQNAQRNGPQATLDLDYIISLGLENHVPQWTEIYAQANEAQAA